MLGGFEWKTTGARWVINKVSTEKNKVKVTHLETQSAVDNLFPSFTQIIITRNIIVIHGHTALKLA